MEDKKTNSFSLSEKDEANILVFVKNGTQNSKSEEIESFVKYQKKGLEIAKELEDLKKKKNKQILLGGVLGLLAGAVLITVVKKLY